MASMLLGDAISIVNRCFESFESFENFRFFQLLVEKKFLTQKIDFFDLFLGGKKFHGP